MRERKRERERERESEQLKDIMLSVEVCCRKTANCYSPPSSWNILVKYHMTIVLW
jgi:hypothetical protein